MPSTLQLAIPRFTASWLPMTLFIAALYALPRLMRLVREGTASVSAQGGAGRVTLRLLGVTFAAWLVGPALGLFVLSASPS